MKATRPDPIRYTKETRASIAAGIEEAIAKGDEMVDGAFVIATKVPCVDFDIVRGPRTKAQRKLARKIGAMGHYGGFVYPETLKRIRAEA